MSDNEMLERNKISCMVIFLNDNHINEYVHPSDNIISGICGFTGSNAVLLITPDIKHMYTDGRYFLQAEKELKNGYVLKRIGIDKKLSDYIKENNSGNVGMDLCRTSKTEYKSIKKVLDDRIIKNVSNDEFYKCKKRMFNDVFDLELIRLKDCIWIDKKKNICNIVIKILEEKAKSTFIKNIISVDGSLFFNRSEGLNDLKVNVYKILHKWNEGCDVNVKDGFNILNKIMEGSIPGISYEDRLTLIRCYLNEDECFIISVMDEIAYLMNLRGNDIPYNTLFYSYMFIDKKRSILFANCKNVKRKLEVREYEKFYEFLNDFCANRSNIKINDYDVVYLSRGVNADIWMRIGNKAVTCDFIKKLKSVKNMHETLGMFQANVLDSISLTKLFIWLESTKEVTERQVSEKLLEIKKKVAKKFSPPHKHVDDDKTARCLRNGSFISEGFESIIATGENAAIIHHRPSEVQIKKMRFYF